MLLSYMFELYDNLEASLRVLLWVITENLAFTVYIIAHIKYILILIRDFRHALVRLRALRAHCRTQPFICWVSAPCQKWIKIDPRTFKFQPQIWICGLTLGTYLCPMSEFWFYFDCRYVCVGLDFERIYTLT